MTAFNNIKTNNWPSASNDLEDFLVLELPLNDQAALTSSRRDIVAGSTVLHPKRTLTNTGVSMAVATPVIYAANVKLHTYIYNTPSVLTVNGTTVPRGSAANGDVTYIVAVNGNLNTIAWSYDSGSGPYCYMKGIEIDYGDGNGYQLLTDGTTNYSNLISGSVESAYPLSNLFGGTIGSNYTNGTRAVNPGTLTLNLAGDKKHYDDNASFNGSSSRLVTPADLNFGVGDFTVECWALSSTTSGEDGIFQLSTNVAGLNASQSDTVTLQTNSGVYRSYINDSSYAFSTAVVANQWTHLALVRNAGTVRLYVNGVVDSTTVSDSRSYSCTHACIGGYYSTNYIWSGNIQDFRAYKGVAKYTANFTPPGAIFD